MYEILSKLAGDGKNSVAVLLAVCCVLYAGKVELDALTKQVEELKQEQKEITKFLAEHATTWARIAERVKILQGPQ